MQNHRQQNSQQGQITLNAFFRQFYVGVRVPARLPAENHSLQPMQMFRQANESINNVGALSGELGANAAQMANPQNGGYLS